MRNQTKFVLMSAILAAACICIAADTSPFADRTPRYKIGRGDVIEISFPRVPEFTQTVTVQPDGYITLKGLEEGADLFVVDKSVPELKAALRSAYSKILHDPAINVELKDFEKPYFTAFGEISKPGRYDLRGQTTVVQALSMSGGFRDGAKTSEVLLIRRVSDDLSEVTKVDIKKMLKTGDLKEDPRVQPGDILFVPKSFLGKIDRFIPNSSVGAMLKPY
jgi:polysaccharide export outer membrane protein